MALPQDLRTHKPPDLRLLTGHPVLVLTAGTLRDTPVTILSPCHYRHCFWAVITPTTLYIIFMNRAVVSKLRSLVCLLLAAESQAKAYVDPGSGAEYYQIFLIGAVGLLFSVKRLVAWFKGRKTTPTSHDAQS